MKKLIALLLAVSMLLVSVFAIAENATDAEELPESEEEIAEENTADEAAEAAATEEEPVAEGETAENDDISEEEETAALEAEDEAVEAEESENADPSEVALSNDRKIVSDINLTTYTEDLAGINGLNIKLSAQNNGLNAFTYDVTLGEDELYNGSLVYDTDNEKLYVTMALLGDETYCFDMHDFIDLLDSMTHFTNTDSTFSLKDQMAMLGLSDLSPSSLISLDLSTLDVSPMMSALVNLNKCITITDVEDYTLADDTVDAGTEAEAEAETEAAEGSDSTPVNVAMMMNIVISRDDMSVLINAMAATIAANSEKLAPLGLDAETFTEVANAIADSFSEDIAAVIGLDADGAVVYACADYSMTDVGAYRIQYMKELSEEGTKYSATVMTSGEESEAFVKIFNGEAYVTDSTLLVRILQGDEADSAAGVQFTAILPSGEVTDYEFDFDTISVSEGLCSYPLSVSARTALTIDDVDFTADGTIKVSANDANDPILDAAVQIKTEAADTYDLSDAVDVGSLDAGEDTDIFSAFTDINNEITE